MMHRCQWCEGDDAYTRYHDEEWGVPVYDDDILFEFLILEGAQAGLSWLTILRKRANYRKAYADFDPAKLARFAEQDIKRCMQDAGIIRNRLKITSAIKNAQSLLDLKDSEDSLSSFLWQFVEGRPVINQWQSLAEIPAQTPQSQAMSKALKQRGFSFVGPTICYALMQAVGMVNDHIISCFRHEACVKLSDVALE